MRIPLSVIRRRNVPLILTREFQLLMNALSESTKEIVKGESLASRIEKLIQSKGFSENNLWINSFRSLLQSYLAEILDSRRTVGDFLEYLYDQSRDSRQFNQLDRNSILLSTMHAAKGMEFPVVLIAGQPLQGKQERDDERRLYYVAMTRAMQQLYCLHHQQPFHPFIPEIAGGAAQSVEHQFLQPVITPEDRRDYHKKLWELELSDIIISFPIYRDVFSHAQHYFSHANPGSLDRLQINERGNTPLITW
jgi:ATP-dependent DNA helicase RecQ